MNVTLRGKQKYCYKNFSQCGFFQNKFNMNRHRIELEPIIWELGTALNDCIEWLHWMTALNDCIEWLYWITALNDCIEWLHGMTVLNNCIEWLHWMTALNDCIEWLHWMTVLNNCIEWLHWMTVLNDSTEWLYCIMANKPCATHTLKYIYSTLCRSTLSVGCRQTLCIVNISLQRIQTFRIFPYCW